MTCADAARHERRVGLPEGEEPGGRRFHAAELWARAKVHKPSIVFTDADLLIAATASFHRQTLVTSEVGFIENLQAIGVVAVHLLSVE